MLLDDIDFLDNNDDWTSDYETSYELTCGCELEEIEEIEEIEELEEIETKNI